MHTNSNSVVLTALLAALRPIARLLMKGGIGYREFSEISKCAFVDVATSDYGLRGRPTNISRVAVMTGLTRKEVKRLREKISHGAESIDARTAPYVAILDHWHDDSDFTDEFDNPLPLEFEGPSPSFAALVKKYGGDIPPGAMRTELKRVEAVTETEEGSVLKVVKRVFRPIDIVRQMEVALGQSLCALASTLGYNISDSIDKGSDSIDKGRIQRSAFAANIRSSDMTRVRRISRDRVAEFVESVNDLYSAYSTIYGDDSDRADDGDDPKTADDLTVVGVGAYYFELQGKDAQFYQ